MTATDLLSIFREIAGEIAERDFSDVAPERAVTDLGIDSLGLMELVGSLERELKVRLPEAELAEVKTVADLLAVVARHQAS